MSKVTLYVILSIVAVAGAAGGYHYFTRTEVIEVPVKTEPPAQPSPQPDKPKPDHGDFKKRFEPTPPAPNGGRNN